MSQERGFPIPADLIRTIAIIGVIIVHAGNDLTISQMNSLEIIRWNAVNIYQTLGSIGVPLFVMLTGFLLLQPNKLGEPIRVFFKKRWTRIGLPILFWGTVYFAWDFLVEHQINNQPITTASIFQGILTGPYLQFWFLYMLIGLYLLTPIIRLVIAHAEPNLIKYLLVIWFLGTGIFPLVGLFGPYQLNAFLFTIPGYAGYFILGAYLPKMRIRLSTLVTFMSIGFALTAIGTYMIAATVGGPKMYFLRGAFSPTTILASAMLFLLLITIPLYSIGKEKNQKNIPNRETAQKKNNDSKAKKLLSLISANTLPIFLFHLIILASLQRGYFGFTLNGNTVNSIVGIPLATVLTLFICLAIIVPLKKVPFLKNLIG